MYAQSAQDSTQTSIQTLRLKEVEVTGSYRRSPIQYATQTVSINNNPSINRLNVSEAIAQLPSVNIGIEGDIRRRGNTDVNLLFNGIPLALFEENRGDVLILFPSYTLNSIETGDNLYDYTFVDGGSGIINLRPFSSNKKEKYLQLTGAMGAHERYNADIKGGISTKKFFFDAGYNFKREYRHRTFRKETINNTGTAYQNNNASAHPNINFGYVNTGVSINANNQLVFNGLLFDMNYDRLGNIDNKKLKPDGSVANHMIRQRDNSQKQKAWSAGTEWKHTFTKLKNASLQAGFNYDNYAYDEDNYFKNKKPDTEQILAQEELFINQEKHQYIAQARFEQAINPVLSYYVGYTGRFKRDAYRANGYNLVNDKWTPNLAKCDTFDLNSNIHLISLGSQISKGNFLANVSLQGDISSRKTDSKHQQVETKHLFTLLPQVNITYSSNKNTTWNISYSQRINRPVLRDLNPYIDTSDPTFTRKGNPSLKNELVHLTQISNTSRFGTFTLNPIVYYAYRSNRIMDIAQVEDNKTIWTKENASNTQSAGLEINASWQPFRQLFVYLTANGYHYEIDGQRQGWGKRKGDFAVDAKGGITYLPFRNTRLQIDGYYTDKQLTPQGSISSLYSVNAGASQYLLNQRMCITLSIQNIFDSMEESTTFVSGPETQYIHRNRDARAFWASISYTL